MDLLSPEEHARVETLLRLGAPLTVGKREDGLTTWVAVDDILLMTVGHPERAAWCNLHLRFRPKTGSEGFPSVDSGGYVWSVFWDFAAASARSRKERLERTVIQVICGGFDLGSSTSMRHEPAHESWEEWAKVRKNSKAGAVLQLPPGT